MSDLSILVRQMCVHAERRMSEFDLGFPELVIIMHLADQGASNQEQIARRFEVDKGSISKTIGKLEGKGFVVRATNPGNKREKIVSLDPSAGKILGKLSEELAAWDERIFAGISDDDRRIMTGTIAKMAENSNRLIHEED